MSTQNDIKYFTCNLNRLVSVDLGPLTPIPGKFLGGRRTGLFAVSTKEEIEKLESLKDYGVEEVGADRFEYETGQALSKGPLTEVRTVSNPTKTSAVSEALGDKALPVTDGPPPEPEVIPTSDPVADDAFKAEPVEPVKKSGRKAK